MLDAHIHRVFILDAQGRPAGVVTATDILAAVADYDDRERDRARRVPR
jgi:CBS domain-containing protein